MLEINHAHPLAFAIGLSFLISSDRSANADFPLPGLFCDGYMANNEQNIKIVDVIEVRQYFIS